MKKNIIMIIIILICSMSLLLVLYYFNSKNIYYISDKIIDNNEITMQIKSGSTYTNLETLNDLDSSKYYRISNETNCSSGTASFYYSNSTNKLKIKVTNNPLKCKIVFEEIREDINIVAIFVDGVEQNDVPTSGWYDIIYTCKNIDGTASNAVVKWDNSAHKLSTENITKQTYCTITFISTNVAKFEYTGAVQTFVVPVSGNYKIELWGASGKEAAALGAYTKGLIYISKNTILSVYVGENLIVPQSSAFNGGRPTIGGWSGGGSTDVRYNGSLMETWDSIYSLNKRIMVAAAGGAGVNRTESHGAGGGLYGYNGTSNGNTGGTQWSPGTSSDISHPLFFGIAGGGSSGGNGYYPGAGGYTSNGSGGGSSYISGHRGCVAITSINTSNEPRISRNDSNAVLCSSQLSEGYNSLGYNTDITCSMHPNGMYFTSTLMIDGAGKKWEIDSSTGELPSTLPTELMPNPLGGYFPLGSGNAGNGYARITYLGS